MEERGRRCRRLVENLKSNLPKISEHVFEAVDPDFPRRAKEQGGGFVVSWTSGHDNGSTIYLQRYDASGAAAGSEVPLSGYGENATLADAVLEKEGFAAEGIIEWPAAI